MPRDSSRELALEALRLASRELHMQLVGQSLTRRGREHVELVLSKVDAALDALGKEHR